MTMPWNIACVAPPSVLPIATADRWIGATSTSFRNPNSRSHTIDTAPKIDVNRTDIPMMPGKMNCTYCSEDPGSESKPPVLPRNEELSPLPNTNRNSTGWASDATTRMRSRQYRIRSRFQMM